MDAEKDTARRIEFKFILPWLIDFQHCPIPRVSCEQNERTKWNASFDLVGVDGVGQPANDCFCQQTTARFLVWYIFLQYKFYSNLEIESLLTH